MLGGCGSITLTPDAQAARIVFNNDDVSRCKFIGEVTGSWGHWYNFLFMTNDSMIRNALIELRNNTSKTGGNTVKLTDQYIEFGTSVTFWGQAHQCK